MHLDPESIVRLNAMHRAEIHQEIVGAHRIGQPWAAGEGRPRRCPLRGPVAALQHAVARLRVPALLERPDAESLP